MGPKWVSGSVSFLLLLPFFPELHLLWPAAMVESDFIIQLPRTTCDIKGYKPEVSPEGGSFRRSVTWVGTWFPSALQRGLLDSVLGLVAPPGALPSKDGQQRLDSGQASRQVLAAPLRYGSATTTVNRWVGVVRRLGAYQAASDSHQNHYPGRQRSLA